MNADSAQVMRVLDRYLQVPRPGEESFSDIAAAAAEVRDDPELHDALARLLDSGPRGQSRLATVLSVATRLGAGDSETNPFHRLFDQSCGSTDPICRIYGRCKAASDRAAVGDRINAATELAALLLSTIVLEWSSLGVGAAPALRNEVAHRDITAALQRSRVLTSPRYAPQPSHPDIEDDQDASNEDRPQEIAEGERIAAKAAKELANAGAHDVIAWAVETFGDRICIASSMADAVIIHLAAMVKPGIDVIFLDTGYHFPETIGTRDAAQAVYPVNLISITPARTVAEQDAELGPRLYERNPDLCCYLRKVVPLDRALKPYDAWITGVRCEETVSRRNTQVVEWDSKRAMVKVNPIAGWTQAEVDSYITENGVLVNPLVDEGYTSVGCATCTMRTKAGADPRSGRWAGTGKTECGLHT